MACGWFAPANARAKDIMLLLEQSPIKGGDISPVAGKYYFEPGSQVTLTAVPKPGYRFLHWLGDVSDPIATKTVVHLNQPKVIIAVFEQNDHRLRKLEQPIVGGGGGGGLFSNSPDLRWPGGLSAGGGSTRPPAQPAIDIPIGGNQAVPEPATGVLLLAGGLLALRRRGGKQIRISKS